MRDKEISGDKERETEIDGGGEEQLVSEAAAALSLPHPDNDVLVPPLRLR